MLRNASGGDSGGGEATVCDKCHNPMVGKGNPPPSNSVYSKHPSSQGAHTAVQMWNIPCLNCHGGGVWGTPGEFGNAGFGQIHGMNQNRMNDGLAPYAFTNGAALGNLTNWNAAPSCGAYQGEAPGQANLTSCANHGTSQGYDRMNATPYRFGSSQ
jgi:hypothetical protein